MAAPVLAVFNMMSSSLASHLTLRYFLALLLDSCTVLLGVLQTLLSHVLSRFVDVMGECVVETHDSPGK